MTKERISSIDILKGIGIILVMLGHALPHDSFVRTLIYTFHMPLFFWCSGLVIMGLHHPIYDVVMFPVMNRLPLPDSVEPYVMVSLLLPILLFVERLLMKYCPWTMGKF